MGFSSGFPLRLWLDSAGDSFYNRGETGHDGTRSARVGKESGAIG